MADKRATAETVREFLGLPAVVERSGRMMMQDVTTFIRGVQKMREETQFGRNRAAAPAPGGRVPDPHRPSAERVSPGMAALGQFAVGLPVRAVAVFIDFVVLAVFAYVLSRWGVRLSLFTVTWTLATFLYYTLYESATGATLGKYAMGLRVVRLDGSPISRRDAVVRNALRFLDAFAFYLVGALVAMNSPVRQRIGDRVAGTVVVMRRSLPALREHVARAARPMDGREAAPASPYGA